MNLEEKPFACDFDGCTQRFMTEDRLSVHRKTHERRMSLSLNLPSRSGETIVDQTPTPSRILGAFHKNWEESGLNTAEFDLNLKNPFEETFRSASSPNNGLKLKIPSVNVQNEDTDSLNTPSIEIISTPMPLAPSIPSTSVINSDTQSDDKRLADPIPETAPISTQSNSADPILEPAPISTQSNSSGECSSTSSPISVISGSGTFLDINSNVSNTKIVNNVLSTSSNTLNSINPPIPVNTATNNLIVEEKRSVSVLPKTIPQSLPAMNKPIIIVPRNQVIQGVITQAPVYQYVIVQPLPQISLNSINDSIQKPKDANLVAKKVIKPLNTTTITSHSSISENKNSIITITSSNKQGSTLSSLVNVASVVDSQQKPQDQNAEKLFSTYRGKPGRRSKFAPPEDPLEKKVRSLERNRAAAMRCRKKKKKWVEELEHSVVELQLMNEKLQAEVNNLKNQVSFLKSQLLQHKECPVKFKIPLAPTLSPTINKNVMIQ
ncbi:cyclic AMP-dependent transcription factor ATF-2-like isoform X2 [Dinothrombium tinctorium]|uniref:Cyclic AMP-dependent transcription factor ATF-2-like isoform X2 n=1 Tax=Dinothrombium tinctorium TaxID=1965070 RepID=A0A443QPI5_9ACAR|nr:cyclic AMP-dependent transcription factor ATF-2-like isoform X2 [Dinothrombium tinctorium]